MNTKPRSAVRPRTIRSALGMTIFTLLLAPLSAADTVQVNIFNFDFSANAPGNPIVDPTISLGDTVRWVWVSGFHDTTAAAGQTESWASPTTSTAGTMFEHTFTNAGVFHYHCSIHGFDNGDGTSGGMSGTITVIAPPVFFGFPHYKLGQAQLTDDGSGNLIVSNIGSSGQDGISIDISGAGVGSGGEDGFRVRFDPLDLAPSTGALRLTATGEFGGVPDSALGVVDLSDNAGSVQVDADFSSLGSSNVRLEVYDGDSFQGSAVVSGGGQVATADSLAGVTIHDAGEHAATPGFSVGFGGPVTITPSAGSPLNGTELRILADSPSSTIDQVARFEIFATDISTFTILGEASLPCPGDLDGDGFVNLTDLGTLLGHYGMTPATRADGDISGDNVIDLTDLGLLLGAYGARCP